MLKVNDKDTRTTPMASTTETKTRTNKKWIF